jgi:hypothetical protein
VLLAGCGGGGPQMARQDAAPLISLADRISREGPCAQARDIRALRARTVALVNAHRIPHALQESLLSGVNAFVEPTCLPAVPAATAPTNGGASSGDRSTKRHGHGHGHDKHADGDGD